ncbi:hypothetical protein XMM3392_003191 [Aliiroseovarius sp. xm-m-339-2]|nr:hypothetical protein [Aliiroseovarius sp. xm-m-339-2]
MNASKIAKVLLFMALVCVQVACAALPTAGPATKSVVEGDGEEALPYVLVEVSRDTIKAFSAQPARNLRSLAHPQNHKTDTRLGTSDLIAVVIFESTSAGENREISLPAQAIREDGTINIPYAGQIQAAGLRIGELEEKIVHALENVTISPQVLVSLVAAKSKSVTVVGDVIRGSRQEISANDRILDVIAMAGGAQGPMHEVMVYLTRDGHTHSLPLQSILEDPRENIHVLPEDVVTLSLQQKSFTAFGSTGVNAMIDFPARGMTLEEALARAGGLLEFRADPNGVFVFRQERKSLVRHLAPEADLKRFGAQVPVVFRMDMSKAEAYFLARGFVVEDKDILYASPAPIIGLQKVIALFQSAAAAGVSARSITQ